MQRTLSCGPGRVGYDEERTCGCSSGVERVAAALYAQAATRGGWG
jgi:hypothetical protein